MSNKPWKNDLVRFHVDFGPPSLFERVRFKMKDVHELYLSGVHFNQRVIERDIPDEVLCKIRKFDSTEWKLVTAEVRRDRGKFYNSTWEIETHGFKYWVTIGIGNAVETVVRKESAGTGKCIYTADYYDFVEEVNRKLMDEESVAH